MTDYTVVLCLVAFVGLLGLMVLMSAIRIVQEYERLVVFRLGRSIGEKGPGLVLLIPFVDRGVKVDLREQVREIPHQTSITKDNAPISIDFLWYFKILDAVQSVIQVGSFETASQGMATTTLRSVIGGIPLDDVLSQREHINELLRTKLDEVTERWGVKVTNVEIREIIPPREVQEAMNRQMTAERVRRAVVTEFDRARARRPSTSPTATGSRTFSRPRARRSPGSSSPKASAKPSCCELRAMPPLWKRSSPAPRRSTRRR